MKGLVTDRLCTGLTSDSA